MVKSLAKNYKFQSIGEYRALLSLYNITVEEVKGEVRGKAYNGLVYSALDKRGEKVGNPLKASLFGKSVGYNALQKHMQKSKVSLSAKEVRDRTKNIVSGVIANCKSQKDFVRKLEKENIGVVFRENNDKRIYGVTFIDHQDKAVFNGSRLGKEFSANAFHELFNGKDTTNQIETKDWKRDFDYQQEEQSSVESAMGVFSFEQHGDDYQEIAFTNRMKRRKKKPRNPKL